MRLRCPCRCLLVVLGAILYCEFLGDYMTLWQCAWTSEKHAGVNSKSEEQHLRAMIMADTHLLGPLRGHWLDKLYREWRMQRAFRAAINLLRPQVVFTLGDLFDEGSYVSEKEFQKYVLRYRELFAARPEIVTISAVGNHDVGFHYRMHTHLTQRFERQFNNTGVNWYTLRNVHFIFINSMAMENDGCHFCEKALQELSKVAAQLDCLKNPSTCKDEAARKHKRYSRPIIMQHFPTYRLSDSACAEHDAPTIEKYRENWEVLSKESTDLLKKLLLPRLAFAGHSHHYCLHINRWGVEEYTVASFSHRNKINPSFLLGTFTATQHAVSKCDMLSQTHIFITYMTAILICFFMMAFQLYKITRRPRFPRPYIIIKNK